MAISHVKFYGKTIKGSRLENRIIRKNKGPQNKKLARGRKIAKNMKKTKEDSSNDVYQNKCQCPKSNDCTNNVCQKNNSVEQCSKSKEPTNDIYPQNELYEYSPKSMGISGYEFYGSSSKRSRYIKTPITVRKLPKLIRISKKDHSMDVYKTYKIIEYCPFCLTKLDPTQFTIHIIKLIYMTICTVCRVTIEIKPYNKLC